MELKKPSGEVLTIQYLRGVAALMVVLQHASLPTALGVVSHLWLGNWGVEIFFVISGFVMWYTTAATAIRPRDFMYRRVIRIVPLYWFFMTLLIAIALTVPSILNSTVLTPVAVLKSFLFIPYYHLVLRDRIAPILFPGWSLNYEMFFYLMFAAGLTVRSLRLRLFLLGATLLVLSGLGWWLQPHNAIVNEITNPKLLMFSWGIGLAAAYLGGLRMNGPVGLVLVSLGVTVYVAANQGAWILSTLDYAGLSSLLVVAGFLALEPFARTFSAPFLKLVGDASYAIYLSHLFALKFPEVVWEHQHWFGGLSSDLFYFAVCMAFATAIGILAHLWIEKPFLSWLRGARRSRKVEPAVAAAQA